MTRFSVENHIAADSAECARLLGEILALVLRQGGAVHPGAVWRERESHMAVTCDPVKAKDQHPLIVLPRELLVPITGAEWAESMERLILRQTPPGITPLQQALLDLHVELYNATGKIPWTVDHHPRVVAARDPAWLEALRAIRPGLYAEPATPARVFLNTRVFVLKYGALLSSDDSQATWPEEGLPIGTGTTSPMGTAGAPAHPAADHSNLPRKTQVLMPLIDTLNHHPRGAPFQLDDSHLSVGVAQPTLDGQCFAAYSRQRDVLDLALHHGYLDTATHFAFSAPVCVGMEGFCRIQVAARRVWPVHPLDPPRTQWDGETLELSHLCGHGEHPERLQTVLRLPLLAIARKLGHGAEAANRLIDDALEALCAANLTALDRVGQAARTQGDQPVARLLVQAAERQAAILRRVMRLQLQEKAASSMLVG